MVLIEGIEIEIVFGDRTEIDPIERCQIEKEMQILSDELSGKTFINDNGETVCIGGVKTSIHKKK
uniref:Uncharacterized protein n=1 Tax=viral metagenome TaxID=1070528 RepID=A0A6M3L5A8_9ZZZZ